MPRLSLSISWIFLALGLCILPWHMQQSLSFAGIFGVFSESAEKTSALMQAFIHGRFWFWPMLAVAIFGFLLGCLKPQARAKISIITGVAGLIALISQGILIGLKGWQFPIFEAQFGELNDRQFGIGFGGIVTFIGFLLLFAEGLARQGYFRGDRFVASAVIGLAASIGLFTFWPILTLLKEAFAMDGDAGRIVSFFTRLTNAKIWGLQCLVSSSACGVVWNTLFLALSAAFFATLFGLCFALIVTRTGFPAKRFLRFLTVLPIITPPFVIGLGLILIFGRSGVINQAFASLTGIELGRWIYGFQGVLLAQVFSFTPTAFLVLIGVVQGISPSLEEAATMLRASPSRSFLGVTLPLIKPGLANAFLVVFIESLADFGNPIVLGGSYGVLSTEIFFAIVGAQSDFGRAASLAFIMLLIALSVFFIQRRVLGKQSFVTVTGKGDGGIARPLPSWLKKLSYWIALPWAAMTIFVYSIALAGGFVKIWGRDWSLTLSHYVKAFGIEHLADGRFIFSGGAWTSLFTTLSLAAIAAPITAALGLLSAWILSRQDFKGRTWLEFALMLTFAVPGTVIGVAYILTYNIPPLEITGTASIIILCFIFRNLPVGVRTGMAAISQIDKSLDEAAITLRASTLTTLRRVLLPLLKPAIVTALIYSFVRAMTTVSAVIFLTSAQYELSTIYIINRALNGDYGVAIATSSVLILMMLGAILLVQLLVGERKLGRRSAEFSPKPEAQPL